MKAQSGTIASGCRRKFDFGRGAVNDIEAETTILCRAATRRPSGRQ
jgi:hypothetical protein